MTTDTDKLVEMARAAGGISLTYVAKPIEQSVDGVAMTPAQLAAFRDRIIASLCGDVEPVGEAFVGVNGQHLSFSKTFGYLKCCPEDEASGCTIRFVYSASTVAALKARVAELEKALQGLVDFHTKPAGVTVEIITEKDLFAQAMADIDAREKKLVVEAIAALTKGQS